MRTRNRRPIQQDADEYDEPLPARGGGYSYDDEDDYQPASKRRPYDQQSRNRNRNTDKRRYKDDNRDDRRYYDQTKRQHNSDDDDRRPMPANDDNSDRRRFRNRRPASTDDNPPPPVRSRDRERPIPRDDFDDEPPAYSTQRESSAPKIRPTGSGSSIFKAPRPPPRISRPVPVNEKKKFEYIRPDKVADGDDDADYEVSFVKYKQPVTENVEKPVGRRDQSLVHNSKSAVRDDDYADEEELPPPPFVSTRNSKPIRNRSPEPIDDVKPPQRKSQSSRYQTPIRAKEEVIEEAAEYEDEEPLPVYKKPNKYSSRSVVTRKSPFLARNRQSAEEYVEPSGAGGGAATAPGSRYANEDYDTVRNQRDSPKTYNSRNPPIIMQRLADREHQRQQQAAAERGGEIPAESRKNVEKNRKPSELKASKDDGSDVESKEISSTVRSVKRPFLPSRGGSPYLPRGLKPVGISQNVSAEPTVDRTELTQIGGDVVITEAAPPSSTQPPTTTTTQKPKVPINNSNSDKNTSESRDVDDYSEEEHHESPRQTLEKIYNSEYDAAINDALNPTLKPLTLSSVSPIGFSLSNRYDRTGGYPYDSISRSSSQLYTQFLEQSPKFPAKSVPNQSQQSQLPYYDDYEY